MAVGRKHHQEVVGWCRDGEDTWPKLSWWTWGCSCGSKKYSLGQKRWRSLATVATGEPWKLRVATDSSYFMQSIWLAPELVPLAGQPFLVLTAVLYSIHPFFNTLSPPHVLQLILLLDCHVSFQCPLPQKPVPRPPFILPYPLSKPLLTSQFFPKFSLLLSLFFILVLLLLSINWSWSISYTY